MFLEERATPVEGYLAIKNGLHKKRAFMSCDLAKIKKEKAGMLPAFLDN